MSKNLLVKLSKKLTPVIVAGAMVFSLSGCADEIHKENLNALNAAVSADSKRTFKYVYAVRLLADDNGYYIQFECHDDKGANSVKYFDHKHVLATYSLEKDNYQAWLTALGKNFVLTQNISHGLLEKLYDITYLQDPIAVEEKIDNLLDGE